METKDRIAVLSAVAFVIGGAVGGITLVGVGAARLYPQLNQPGEVNDVWVFLAFVVAMVSMLMGMLVSCVLWLLLMKPWFSRRDLETYFTQPFIPLITPILAWIFGRLYPRAR